MGGTVSYEKVHPLAAEYDSSNPTLLKGRSGPQAALKSTDGKVAKVCWSDGPLQQMKAFHGKYTLGSKLGKGVYGKVYAVKPRSAWEEQDDLAAKIVDLRAPRLSTRSSSRRSSVSGSGSQGLSPASRDRSDQAEDSISILRVSEVEEEVRMWRMIPEHANVVQLREVFSDELQYCMVMDRCAGSLKQMRATVQTMHEPEIASTFRQMVCGVEHLHALRICHRDVKPENFLIGAKDGRIKLCDFGYAIVIPKNAHGTGCCGTAPYMSPEMAGSRGHTLTTDVWSLGATFYTLLYEEYPYIPPESNSQAMKHAILVGEEPRFFVEENPKSYHALHVGSFVRSLMVRDAGQRCAANQALEHALFQEYIQAPVQRRPRAGGFHN